MKVIKVVNNYSDTPKTYYNYENLEYFLDSIIDEVKTNIEAFSPIRIETIEMTEEEWEKLPELT